MPLDERNVHRFAARRALQSVGEACDERSRFANAMLSHAGSSSNASPGCGQSQPADVLGSADPPIDFAMMALVISIGCEGYDESDVTVEAEFRGDGDTAVQLSIGTPTVRLQIIWRDGQPRRQKFGPKADIGFAVAAAGPPARIMRVAGVGCSNIEGEAGIQSFGEARVDLYTQRLDAIVTARDERSGHRSIHPVRRIIGQIEDRDWPVIAQGIAAQAIITEDRCSDPDFAKGRRGADKWEDAPYNANVAPSVPFARLPSGSTRTSSGIRPRP